MKTNLKRLTQLAEILSVADAKHVKKGEPTYYQEVYMHDCGTPACALGHWAAAHPKRWRISGMVRLKNYLGPWSSATAEFGLNRGEACEIFDTNGCGRAKTAKQAAAYIRRFVARKAARMARVAT